MSEDAQTSNIVDEHRKMVVLTGNISEFQLKNIKAWPFIIFDQDLLKCEIKYDFTDIVEVEKDLAKTLNAGVVEYDFYFKKDPMDKVSLRLAQLSLWTRFMFWEDTGVVFKKEGKLWQPN